MINAANAKGIIFSTAMVKAIQEGQKTQTRRVIKPQPPEEIGQINGPEWYTSTVIDRHGMIEPGPEVYGIYAEHEDWGVKCPHMPGDILYVRETWADLRGLGFGNNPITGKPWDYVYKADIVPDSDEDRARIDYGVKWRPSIFMPKKAARIFLTVTNVGVERLQDITPTDIDKEGTPFALTIAPYDGFSRIWDSLNAKRGYGWDKNPWVWVYCFERAEMQDE